MTDKKQQRLAWLAATGFILFVFGLGIMGWLVVDVDQDGQATYQELAQGTSPTNSDSDGDGLPDGYEAAEGLDPTTPEAPLFDPRLPCGILTAECQEEADAPSNVESETAPSAGRSGSLGTVAIAGVTSLVAGIGARVISQAILHR